VAGRGSNEARKNVNRDPDRVPEKLEAGGADRLGTNIFVEYEREIDHSRWSFGTEILRRISA
jgi:hypothetical protein